MTTTTKNYSELMTQALEEVKNDNDLLVEMVNELDGWNGYADGFRGFPMYELNDLFYGVSLTEFLDKLGRNFDHNDNYFIDTIYGIESTDDLAEVYRDNVDEGELLDDFIEQYECGHVDIWGNDDFKNLLDDIIEARDAEADEADED